MVLEGIVTETTAGGMLKVCTGWDVVLSSEIWVDTGKTDLVNKESSKLLARVSLNVSWKKTLQETKSWCISIFKPYNLCNPKHNKEKCKGQHVEWTFSYLSHT